MRKIYAVFVLVISITLSGCFPTGAKDAHTSNDFTEDKTFEYKAPHINVSFEIPQIQGNLPPMRIKLKEKTFDKDEMLNLFFEGKTILEEKTFGNNYWTDDESHLSVDSNSISYSDGKTANAHEFAADNAVNYQGVLLLSMESNKEMFFSEGDELEDFPLQDAMDCALELTSRLGISNLGEPEIYAASLNTYEKFKEYNYMAFFNEEYPLTKDNEIYVFRFPQVYNGVELAHLRQVTIDDNTEGEIKSEAFSSKVTVGVSKDRIFYFEASGVCEPDYEIISAEPTEYDLNYALSELRSYLEKNNYTKNNYIDNAQMVYYPVERREPGYVEYSLAWGFDGYERDDIYSEEYKIVVSSESGIRNKYEKG